jgi:hypothetical protein
VLWCNADQSPEILEEQFEDQGIHRDSWLRVWNGFRMSYRKRLVDELNRYQPALVVIDSLSASQPTIDGNKQIASSGLYWLENNNGLLWPATCFLIIHHNNKQGGFRGHSSIRDAVSETWSIRKLDDTEVESDEYGSESFRKRVITIGKSRNGREGDKLVTTLNEDFTMNLEDYTPVRRVRQGGSVPVIDKVLGQLREDTAQGVLRTRKELEALLMRPMGDKAIEKSLTRLRKRGLIESFDAERQHRVMGKREKVYAAVTAVNTKLSAASRGDIHESVSDLQEPAPALSFSNQTANQTTLPVGLENVHPATKPHPSTDEVDQVHLSLIRQDEPVGFEDPSEGNGFAKSDSSGERVEEPPVEGDLDLSAYDLEGEPPSWGPSCGECVFRISLWSWLLIQPCSDRVSLRCCFSAVVTGCSEPGSFFAETEGEGVIIALWCDETGEITLALLDEVRPMGSFFLLTPSLLHELADNFQACDQWIRAQGGGTSTGPGADACGRRGDDRAQPDCRSTATSAAWAA